MDKFDRLLKDSIQDGRYLESLALILKTVVRSKSLSKEEDILYLFSKGVDQYTLTLLFNDKRDYISDLNVKKFSTYNVDDIRHLSTENELQYHNDIVALDSLSHIGKNESDENKRILILLYMDGYDLTRLSNYIYTVNTLINEKAYRANNYVYMYHIKNNIFNIIRENSSVELRKIRDKVELYLVIIIAIFLLFSPMLLPSSYLLGALTSILMISLLVYYYILSRKEDEIDNKIKTIMNMEQ